MTCPVYIVTAYRYGWMNNGGYHVWAGTSPEDAIAHAQSESTSGACKYGVVVRKAIGGELSIHCYFPSGRNEPAPTIDHSRQLADRIGWRILGEIEDGITAARVHEIYVQEKSISDAAKEATDA